MQMTISKKYFNHLTAIKKKGHVILTVGPEHEPLGIYRIKVHGDMPKDIASQIIVTTQSQLFSKLESFYKEACKSNSQVDTTIESVSAECIVSNIFDIGLAFVGPTTCDEPGINAYNNICNAPGKGLYLTAVDSYGL